MEALALTIRPPTTAFYHSICEIYDADDQVVGAGMIIDPVRIVTCAHVAAAALGMLGIEGENAVKAGRQRRLKIRRSYLPDQTPMVWLEFYRSRFAPSTDKFADLAVLHRCEGKFTFEPEGGALVPDLSTSLTYGERVIATGFPDDKADARSRLDDAAYVIGAPTPAGWFNVVAEGSGRAVIRGGYSGGPVWSKDQGAVVGISSEANEARGTAAIIPVRLLSSIPKVDIELVQPTAKPTGSEVILTAELSRLSPLRRILEWTAPGLHSWLTLRLEALVEPAERRVLADEMAEFAARLSVEVSGATYLPPLAREPKADAAVGFQPLRQMIRAIGHGYGGGGDGATAELSALSRRSRPVRRLLKLLLTSRDAVILLGDPGSGKSLTLQQTALKIAEINRSRVCPDVSVFVRLGRWTPSQAKERPGLRDVEQLVLDQAPPALKPFIPALARAGRLIAIFDGMDEMSRQRYIEHTSALSEYAVKYVGQVRCLFSCRISDFAPVFPHRRLVLLPFDRRHVLTYLQRQLGQGRISLGRRQVTTDELAQELVAPDFPVRAANPYMLYLLCLYVRDKHDLPTRRIDVLDYFFSSSLDRETKDQQGVHLERNLMFDQLGLLALEVTTRNAGSEILRVEVDSVLGKLAGAVVRLACDAGILVQAVNEDERVPAAIRFSNHRAQEFFTAHALVESAESFQWANKLDIPRWQETLVNLAQFGGDRGGGAELAKTLDAAISGVQSIQETTARSLAEADAAERAHLAARVARDLGATDERAHLVRSTEAAIIFLAKSADAVSRAATLRIVHQLPEIGGSVLALLLNDVSQWVRDQARLVAAEVSKSDPKQRLAEGIIDDYALGETLFRLPAYLATAKRLRSRGMAIAAGIASICFITQLFLMTASGPVLGMYIHANAPELFKIIGVNKTEIGRLAGERVWFEIDRNWPLIMGLQLIVAIGASLTVIARRIPQSWIFVLGAGALANIAPLFILFAWFSAEHASVAGITHFIFVSIAIFQYSFFAIALGSGALYCLCSIPLGVFLASWVKSPSLVHKTWQKILSESGSLERIKGIAFGVIGFGIIILIVALSPKGVLSMLRVFVIQFPILPEAADVPVSISMWIALSGLVIVIFRYIHGNRDLLEGAIFTAFFAAVPSVIAGIYWIVVLIGRLLSRLDGFWQYIIYPVLIVITVGLMSAGLFAFYKILLAILAIFRSRLIENSTSAEVRASFRKIDASVQPMVIAAVTPERLHLSIDDTIALLQQMYGDAKSAFVCDTLDRKRAELLALRRHKESEN
ncbi:serine protease [Mesorhizobium neociceri]|uniref:Trypsin-like peptidase domain-containing protein n=1 Tax=Mesorhizobium neociceri TaxID=1307853 RepID=A0A838BE82_9HYPH|nr:serine protease [Mesorhizobium neociceri]MBA1144846.1 trypsin-like peptidase domain-containing protein [Mesorhizobium neociceri]